ncbi:MAG: hypothetical protein ABJ322_07330 [Marinobacter sp.]|uniref:hypothetical protein n=1 Tax=Marinobacter sp. TaxID=50741 RepID=UPI003299B5B8
MLSVLLLLMLALQPSLQAEHCSHEQDSMTGKMMHGSVDQSHAGHDMSAMNEPASQDCCDADCKCPSSACSGMLAVLASVSGSDLPKALTPRTSVWMPAIEDISDSLLRPPIPA